MPGKYIRCEVCAKTFHGDPMDHQGVWRPRGYWYGQGGMLRQEATAKGWVCDAASDTDVCPECKGKNPGHLAATGAEFTP